MAIYEGSTGRRQPIVNYAAYRLGPTKPKATAKPKAPAGRSGGPSPYSKRRQAAMRRQGSQYAPWSPAYIAAQQKGAQSRLDFASKYNLPDDTEPYYLGGYPASTAYAMGPNLGFLQSRLGMQIRDPGVTVAKPKYVNGMQNTYAARSRLSPSQVAQWQAFFQMNGWKTGVYGVWGPQEASAMGDFMGMANGVQGGATVEQMRDRVMREIEAGRIGPGELADTFGGSGGGGGGGEVGYEGPITETSTRTIITQASEADAMLLLRGVLEGRLGRAPNQAEIKRFLRELNGAYRADPTVITTTTVTDQMAGTVESTTDEKQSSVNPQAESVEFGQEASPNEAAAYTRLNVFNALMAELGM